MIELNGKRRTYCNDKISKDGIELVRFDRMLGRYAPDMAANYQDGLELVRFDRILGRYAPDMATIHNYYGLFLETQLLPKRRVIIIKYTLVILVTNSRRHPITQ